MAQDLASPLDPVANASEKRRVLNALRKRQALLEKDSVTADPYFSYKGNYVAPNYSGMIQNALDTFQKTKLENELGRAEDDDDLARRAMLESVMNDPEEMTTQKLLRLSDAGVEADTLKLLKPEKVSKGAMYQAISNNPAMASLFVGEGLITQEQADQVVGAYRSQKEADINDRIRIAAAGRSSSGGRSESDAEWFRRDPEGYRAFKEAGRAPSAGGRGGKNYVDPVKSMEDMKNTTARLEDILKDPKSDEELFSVKQRIVVPAVMDTPENASLVERVASQTALGERSPMAGEVHRLATEQSFDVVKQLYPASNSDIKLAQSLQAKVGESRESMQRYVDQRNKIIRKAETGQYGDPVLPDGGSADDQTGLSNDGWSIEEIQ